MRHEIPSRGGDEADVFSRYCRTILTLRPRTRRMAKRGFNRRLRRWAKAQAKKENEE